MANLRSSRSLVASWVRRLFQSNRPPIRRRRSRLTLESLEDRLSPALFTGAATTLTIDLNNPSENVSLSTNGTTITAVLTGGTAGDGGGTTAGNVTGFVSGTALINSAAFTNFIITDSAAGASVQFANSTGAYPQAFSITLDDPASGDVSFFGASTFKASFIASTTGGNFSSTSGSPVTLTGAGSNLTLTATGHDILLAGPLNVGGTTKLTANVIQIDNVVNDFVGAVQLSGPVVISIRDMNDLDLAASSLVFGTLAQTSHITAGGNITQSGALTVTGTTGTLAVTSLGGLIDLSNAGNNISSNVAVALSATGANNVTVVNTTGLLLGNVTLGTNTLSLTAAGNMTQAAGTSIQTGGAVTLTVSANNADISLLNPSNKIAGTVTVVETTASFLRDFKLRNTSDNAALPAGTPFTTAGDVRNLTLLLNNTGIALPGYSITGSLIVAAGGDVTQTAALTVALTTTVTISGDFGINLNNSGNAFTGAVGLRDTQSTQAVVVVNGSNLVLGFCDLGRGTFSATAALGNIIESSNSITQRKGAGDATFTVTAGATIDLSTGANDFTSGVVFAGKSLTIVGLRNTDFQAKIDDLTVPSSVTDLTLTFDNAAAVLPSETLTNLTVTALGVVQNGGGKLNLSGTGTFSAGAYSIDLSGNNNSFVNLTLNNSGRNDVTVAAKSAITFTGTSNLGSGRLSVTAAGAITEAAKALIAQANTGPDGDVGCTSSGGSVTLTGNNQFRGALSISVSGANAASITNKNVAVVLGAVTTGSGTFTVSAGTSGVSQDPNSVLNLGGTSSFTAGTTVTLTNRTNTFGGSVALSAPSASLRATGAVVLAASNVTSTVSVQSGGAAGNSITQTGAVTGGATATFNAGAGDVILTKPANDFGAVSVSSTGNTVSITDVNALNVGNIVVGGGTLTITTGGNLGLVNVVTSGIVQTAGAGAITLNTPAGASVILLSPANSWRGPVTVSSATNVSLENQGDMTFSPGSAITGVFIATAGGTLTLPTTVNVASLSLTAKAIAVANDLTASGNVALSGTVNLTGNRAITSGGNVTFSGDVNVGGTVTLNMLANQSVGLARGTWNEGANDLTIDGSNVTFTVGGGLNPARFVMTGGTVNMPGSGVLNVGFNDTFQVGTNAAAAETVTVANGSGGLTINGALAVGFGAVNDQLIKSGSGVVSIAGGQLVGSGLAGAAASPVLASQTGLIVGTFFNSVDAAGTARDFFAGSDIVTASYSFTQVAVKAGGTAAPSGTATGTLSDGDNFSVKSSLGAAAGLVTTVDVAGNLDVVVRNSTSAATAALTIATTGGGDGQLQVGGVAIHSPGAVSVSAATTNFTGFFTTAGTLTALTARDLGSLVLPFVLTDGGPITAATTITAGEVGQATITLAGALQSLKATSVTSLSTLTAQKFGSLTTTGNPATLDRGDFNPTLISTTTVTGTVLASATVAGELRGTWDLRGNVGAVKAVKTTAWSLGAAPAAASDSHNAGLLGDVTSLNLGDVLASAITATGKVGSLTATQVNGNTFNAGSFGTVTVTGSAALGLAGSFSNSTLTSTGNAGGVALNTLTIVGDLGNSSALNFLNGDVNAITVGRTVNGSMITAIDTGSRGAIKSLTAGKWSGSNLDARAIGTFKITGNLAAGLFGDFIGSTVTVRSNTAGVGLSTFSAAGSVTGSFFDVQNGSVTSFTVGRTLGTTLVQLSDPTLGNLGTIQAGDWAASDTVIANTIKTIASVGAAAASPASPLLVGGFTNDTITAYIAGGSNPAIGTLSAKGDFLLSNVIAERGIATMTVGRSVNTNSIVADDALGGAVNVGRVNALTVGAWIGSALSATTLGAVKITGYSQPENATTPFVFGDVTSATFIAHGGTPTTPIGINSFTVARHFSTNSSLKAPFGIKALAIGGSLLGTSEVVTSNPLTPTAGFVTSFTAGHVIGATVRVGGIGTMKVTGSAAFGLQGSVNTATIAADSGATTPAGLVAVGSLTVAGDFRDAVLDAPNTVSTIAVAGRVEKLAAAARIEAGYAAGAKLGSLTVGAWGVAGIGQTTDLVSQAVGTFRVKGNAASGVAGTVDFGFIDILGSAAGVGLGTFSATGTISNSLFHVSDGDVTSFTALRFSSSDLLVGFRPVKGDDITLAPTAANWSATNHKIGSFTTTAALNPLDVADSASFEDSNVVAAVLGNITLSGVNPVATSTKFGVAFRNSAGAAAKGVVKINGAAAALNPPFFSGQFNYLGLAG